DVRRIADLGASLGELGGILPIHTISDNELVLEYDESFVRDIAHRQQIVRHVDSSRETASADRGCRLANWPNGLESRNPLLLRSSRLQRQSLSADREAETNREGSGFQHAYLLCAGRMRNQRSSPALRRSLCHSRSCLKFIFAGSTATDPEPEVEIGVIGGGAPDVSTFAGGGAGGSAAFSKRVWSLPSSATATRGLMARILAASFGLSAR